MLKPDNARCPCDSGKPYPACCGAYLDSDAHPKTAEQLMRSRYTAYVRRRADYLLATWHPATRPAELDVGADPVKWIGLAVLDTQAGGPDDREGFVEFVARYKVHGRAARLHERSRFVSEEGHWFYVAGEGA